MKKILSKVKLIYYVLLPLLLYFGQRSYIAQDEGYYALQAKWILLNNNWIAPLWFQSPNFDRTIGIQWIIAFFNKIFGDSIFVTHLPSIIFGFIILYLTYKFTFIIEHIKYKWISPLILVTTYLWLNNVHLSTQDIPLLGLELIGIYNLYKIKSHNQKLSIFLSSFWIGPAIFIKSFMALLPIIAILPYVFVFKQYIFKNKYFYLGLITGFLPLIYWLMLCIKTYGTESIYTIFYKLKYLNSSDQYSQPFYYYLWNIPINTMPWIIFSLAGFYYVSIKENIEEKFLLLLYPLILIILLSIFKTKTPYYGLQITPFIAITSNIGIENIFNKDNNLNKIFKRSIGFIGYILILISITLLFINLDITNTSFNNKYMIAITCSSIGIFWSLLYNSSFNLKKNIILLLIGPYIAFLVNVQSGTFTNRDITSKDILLSANIQNIIGEDANYIYYKDELSNKEFSMLVKIAIYTNNNSKLINNFKHIQTNNLIWLKKDYKLFNKENFSIVYENEIIKPWVLVKKY